MNRPNFEQELRQLINKHSIENESDTPDFILANYIMNCLQSLHVLTKQREDWYGRTPKEMEGFGFKDVKDCNRNREDINALRLSKDNSNLEKIIKYVSLLNKTFANPYYFTWSCANNHYDNTDKGVILDPGYASLSVGRQLANGKKIETHIFFGPINSIVDTHIAFRYLIEPKEGKALIDLSYENVFFLKKLIDETLQKAYGIPREDFMVTPPAESKPLPIPQDGELKEKDIELQVFKKKTFEFLRWLHTSVHIQTGEKYQYHTYPDQMIDKFIDENNLSDYKPKDQPL